MDVALIQKHFSSGTTRTLDHIRQIIDILSSFPSKVRSKSLRPRGFQCVECAIPKRFLLLLLLLSIDYFFVTFEKNHTFSGIVLIINELCLQYFLHIFSDKYERQKTC